MTQSSGIWQGFYLSPYLLILTMNSFFEQVYSLKPIFCRRMFGVEYEPIIMNNLELSELLFADDTLVFAESGCSPDAFLRAIEAISGVYGLALNRNKSARVFLNTVPNNKFSTGEDVPKFRQDNVSRRLH